ncbi:formylglycine-generating enzyme family protein [Vibrio sp. MA40-2]|uniref:formylglycine-generating enzyme family protein n=1 Tax=Vibrio sp. MA40-2 TaxID=3391828 RepID=UPI0039A52EA9
MSIARIRPFLLLVSMLTISSISWASKGILEIVTYPGDARIYINGQRKGNSPVSPKDVFTIKLKEGGYKIEAVKPDGTNYNLFGEKVDVFVSDDSKQIIKIKLSERVVSDMFRQKLAMKYLGSIPEPEMVDIPGGSFEMGSTRCCSSEKPVHKVTISAFQMSKTETTFEQWDACVADGGCDHYPDDEGWGRGRRPVINVSWDDVDSYARWLKQRTGKNYRIPSEAEWEYATRAGSSTLYSWGDQIGENKANCSDCKSQWDNDKTAPVASFDANAFGLFDMHGNVWEWTQDCWKGNYKGAPIDGQPWFSNNCGRRVLRGGSWSSKHLSLRSAARIDHYIGSRSRYNHNGFRLVKAK